MWKTILSWIVALFVAFIFVRMAWMAIGLAFKMTFLLAIIVLTIIFALPLVVIIRKKIFK